jgi:prepilin-type N-terminal cleavage/methylation domain-containing protein
VSRTRALAGQHGVTFLELAVVLGILGVVAALVLPAIGRGSASLEVRREAGRVAALLREARLRAVRERTAVRVSLDRARNMVTLEAAASTPAREVGLAPGLRLAADRGGDTLTFTSRGFTRDARWVVEGPGGRRMAIDVTGVTGRVTVGNRS